MESTKPQISPDLAADAFAALGSEQRLSILRALVRAGREGLTVGLLQAKTGMAASTLNHHLRALSGAGVIEQERDGRRVICRARYARIEGLAAFLLSECCEDAGDPCHRHDSPEGELAND